MPSVRGELRDHLHDRARVLAQQHLVDEGAVDLQRVEREAAQVGQRRVAGAEVVQRHAHAQVAQRVQLRRARRATSSIEHRLGDLQLQPCRASGPMSCSASRTMVDEARRRAAATGDTLTDTAQPGQRPGGGAAGLAQRPAAELVDQAASARRSAMNSAGPTRPSAGCSQRISASAPTMRHWPMSTLGCQCSVSSLVLQRVAQAVLDGDAAAAAFAHASARSTAQAAAAVLLGGVERGVGLHQQLVDADVARRRTSATPTLAPTRRCRPCTLDRRRCSASIRRCASDRRPRAARRMRHQHRELVAAQARHQVAGAQAVAQALRHALEQLVAGAVAEACR